MGVASSSLRTPLKTAGFDVTDMGFGDAKTNGDAKTYGDWAFTFVPGRFRGGR